MLVVAKQTYLKVRGASRGRAARTGRALARGTRSCPGWWCGRWSWSDPFPSARSRRASVCWCCRQWTSWTMARPGPPAPEAEPREPARAPSRPPLPTASVVTAFYLPRGARVSLGELQPLISAFEMRPGASVDGSLVNFRWLRQWPHALYMHAKIWILLFSSSGWGDDLLYSQHRIPCIMHDWW